MRESAVIKIHKSQRAVKREKREKRKEQRYPLTPPKYFDSESMYNKVRTLQKRLGYDYDSNGSKTLKWMHQDFQNKLLKYLGNNQYAQRLSRLEKVQMKERLNFKMEKNPLMSIFNKVNLRVEECLLRQGFQALQL